MHDNLWSNDSKPDCKPECRGETLFLQIISYIVSIEHQLHLSVFVERGVDFGSFHVVSFIINSLVIDAHRIKSVVERVESNGCKWWKMIVFQKFTLVMYYPFLRFKPLSE